MVNKLSFGSLLSVHSLIRDWNEVVTGLCRGTCTRDDALNFHSLRSVLGCFGV